MSDRPLSSAKDTVISRQLKVAPLEVLAADPFNRTRQQNIKKLEGVLAGEGQYRLSLGRWRFRYDIVEDV